MDQIRKRERKIVFPSGRNRNASGAPNLLRLWEDGINFVTIDGEIINNRSGCDVVILSIKDDTRVIPNANVK